MKRVVLHIDRLVLRGVAPADAHAVRSALQAELGALLATASHTPLHTSAARLRPAAVTLPAGADAAALGRAVAGGIAGGTAAPRKAGP